MAVIITNMDMPRGCFECPLREEHGWEGDWCAVSEGCDLIGETTRPDYCPLIEVAQEPILNKIRAEIETKYGRCKLVEYIVQYDGICTRRNEMGDIADILQIIDRYKAETEGTCELI